VSVSLDGRVGAGGSDVHPRRPSTNSASQYLSSWFLSELAIYVQGSWEGLGAIEKG